MNVTRQQATEAAREGARLSNKRVYIWFDNMRDGWHWDFEDSPWLGHKINSPITAKLWEVTP